MSYEKKNSLSERSQFFLVLFYNERREVMVKLVGKKRTILLIYTLDIKDFYPSITEPMLDKVISIAHLLNNKVALLKKMHRRNFRRYMIELKNRCDRLYPSHTLLLRLLIPWGT